MLTIQLNSSVTINDQIFAGIRRLIASGKLCPGDELPTVRQLAADLGINLNTAARAYRSLEEAGLVATVRGRGTQVTSAREKVRGSARENRRRISDRLCDALSDARLAGLNRPEIESLIQNAMQDYWPAA